MPEMLKPVERRDRYRRGRRHRRLAARERGHEGRRHRGGAAATVKDYPFDEIKNDIRDTWGRFKANKEVPTTRPTRASPRPARSVRSAR